MDSKIGMWVATAVALGAIIGAGIFVLSGTAIALAGSWAILAFIIVGFVALLIALQLGQLGVLMPKLNGASYSYVYEAFGSELGFITGLLLYFSYGTGISAIALGFGSYLSSFMGFTSGQYAIDFAIILIMVLSLLNIAGIKKAVRVDSGLVILKIAILIIFVAFAFIVASGRSFSAFPGNFANLPAQNGLGALFSASVVIFFAYSGFQVISTLIPRINGGGKAASKALVLSVFISTALYALVAISMIMLVPVSKYAVGADPLSFALTSSGAPQYMFVLVSIGALIATASATLAMIISASRTLYQIAEDRLVPGIFRNYSRKYDVPKVGVAMSAIVGMAMLFSGNIYVIAAISNFGLLISYLMTSVALIHFRKSGRMNRSVARGYPYLQIITIVALIAFLYGMPQIALQLGAGIIIALVVIYYALREAKGKRTVRVKFFR